MKNRALFVKQHCPEKVQNDAKERRNEKEEGYATFVGTFGVLSNKEHSHHTLKEARLERFPKRFSKFLSSLSCLGIYDNTYGFTS